MAARRASKKGSASSSAGKSAAKDRSRSKADEKSAHREFVSEAEEILERMLEDLSELFEQRSADAEVDPDLVNRIFRSAHSLKGLAGMFGLDAIGDLSHHLEDILDGLRLGRVSLESPGVGLLDEGVALLGTLMAGLGASDSTEEADRAAVRDFIERIDAALQQPASEGADALQGLDLDPSLLRALTEYEEHRLRENLRRGRHIAMIDSTFEIATFEEGLSELTAALREVGEVVSTLPSPGDAPESQIRFSLLVATDTDAERLRARLELPNTTVEPVGPQPSAEVGAAGSAAADPGPASDAPDRPAEVAPSEGPVDGTEPPVPDGPATPGAAHPAEAAELESLRSISDTVRVDIRKLDELMNLVGELVIQRNAIANVAKELSAVPQTARIGVELNKVDKTLDRKLKELQTGVLDVRMVPLRQVFEKLSRVARRLRRDLGKEVDLEFSGSDTELDKLIVEQLIDPLVHIVRNSFDHGIESAAERERSGKPPHGRISVRATQRGNHVAIEVEDDGCGMDADTIRSIAVARGLIGEHEQLPTKELLQLVFEPGFSTRTEVSETSGRGVGMDVVRNNLAAMGGAVELATRPGAGTTVTITLPITLAIIQALIAGIGNERFAIPLTSVLETMSVEPSQIGRSEGREILDLRGEPLRLRRLADEFGIEAAGRDERQFVVVLGLGDQRLGLLVDRLEGQQDTVIKPIKGPIQQIRGIAGATELGDRGAILVIDVSAIVGDSARRREAA